eukprot:g12604.t1
MIITSFYQSCSGSYDYRTCLSYSSLSRDGSCSNCGSTYDQNLHLKTFIEVHLRPESPEFSNFAILLHPGSGIVKNRSQKLPLVMDYEPMEEDAATPSSSRVPLLDRLYALLEEDLAGKPANADDQQAELGRFEDGICSWWADVKICCCSCFCTWYPFAISRDQAGVLPFHTAALVYALPWFFFWICGIILLAVRPEGQSVGALAIGPVSKQYPGACALVWLVLIFYIAVSTLTAVFRVKFKTAYGMPADYFQELILAMAGCKICMNAQDARHSKKHPLTRLEP